MSIRCSVASTSTSISPKTSVSTSARVSSIGIGSSSSIGTSIGLGSRTKYQLMFSSSVLVYVQCRNCPFLTDPF